MRLLLSILLVCLSTLAFGQASQTLSINIPKVALVDINGSFEFDIVAPKDAGNKLEIVENKNDVWINYSSIIGDNPNNIYVTADNIPAGIKITVEAGKNNGGSGSLGESTGVVSLSGNAQKVISNIGSSFTGRGNGAGHKMSYKISVDDYSKLRVGSSKVNITYTISE